MRCVRCARCTVSAFTTALSALQHSCSPGPAMNESEWQTRKKRIDARLRSRKPAWDLMRWHGDLDVSALRCHSVTEFPTANDPSDYALFVGGKLIEAKKVTRNPQNVIEQAQALRPGCEG